MKALTFVSRILLLVLCLAVARAQDAAPRSPVELFAGGVQKMAAILEPAADGAQTFSARLEFLKSDGLPKELQGQSATLAVQAPDYLRLSADFKGHAYALGRDRQQIWFYVAEKHWGVVGKPGESRFLSAPEKKDNTKVGPLRLPLPREQLALLPLLFNVTAGTPEKIGDDRCFVIHASPKPEAIDALKIPAGNIRLWLREKDLFPVRVGYSDGKATDVQVALHDPKFSAPWAAEQWKIPAQDGDKIETTAVGHLTRAR
jgi:outer membrane lipoprotein-sorting protein